MFVNCLNPQYIYNKYTHEHQYVSCGKCAACLSARADSLKQRLMLESQAWKYTIFFTLTYNDKYLPYINCYTLSVENIGECYDQELHDALCECAPLVDAFSGNVPVPSKRDIQLFIKRLRKNVTKNEKVPEHRFLRYFVASEYGPTGLRPHYHGLLFTNSEWLSAYYSQAIGSAWSDYDPVTCKWSQYGFTRSEISKGASAAYCSAYCTVTTHLPRLLQHKIFRPFQLYSKHPPLGSHVLQAAQIRAVVDNGFTHVTIEKPDTGENQSIPLWRYLENQLFPKIKNYNKLTPDERIKLYTISVQPEFDQDYKTLICHLMFYQHCNGDVLQLVLDNYVESVAPPDGNFEFYMKFEPLRKLWVTSKNFVYMCNLLNKTPSDYLEVIEKHYKTKDYEHLVKQLTLEEQYLTELPKNDPAFLPLLIDLGFAENTWCCSDLSREEYFKQFNYDPVRPKDYRDSKPYRDLYERTTRWQFDTHKTRAKNELNFYNPNYQKIQKALKLCQSIVA